LTGQKCQNRSPQKQRLVCTTGQNWFFQKQFGPILKRLQNSKQTPSIWSLSTLHCSHYTAFNLCQKSYCKLQRNHCCKNHNQQIQNHKAQSSIIKKNKKHSSN
jgi:hypothetical protein